MKKSVIFILGFAICFSAYLWYLVVKPHGSTTYSKMTTSVQSDAMNALDFLAAQRAYPERVIPDAGFYKAYEYSKAVLNKGERGLKAQDTWQTIGPANRGGRTIALVVDPNNPSVVYAGSASGGLWRLTINTDTPLSYSWKYIDTGYPVLGVNAVAVNPWDSNVLYIGTGEVYGYQSSIVGLYIRTTRGTYGIGLLKSTDYGVTWTKSIDWSYSQQRGVLAIEINPKNPDIIYAGTTEGTYKSTDAGQTWTQVHSGLMAVDVAINPNYPDTVFVSCGNLGSPGSGIYRTFNGGATWTKLSGGLPASWSGKTLLDMYKANPSVIIADVANDFNTLGIYVSTNNGIIWTQKMSTIVDYANYQGWFSHYVRVNPADQSKLLIAGIDFYKSTDGGVTVSEYSLMHVDHHCFANHPSNPNIVYFGNDGGVYRTVDGGTNYQVLNNGYVTAQFYNGFSSSMTNPNLALGGLQDNGTSMYQGTPQWINGVLGGDGAYTAINPFDNNYLYGSSQYLNMYRSTNGGSYWASITGGINRATESEDALLFSNETLNKMVQTDPVALDEECFVAPFELAPSQPWIMYAGTNRIYRSENLGSNWGVLNNGSPLNGNPMLAIGISYTNSNVVYIATVPKPPQRAEVYKSTDGGITWQNITGSLPDRYYVDLKVSPHNEQVVYITLSGFGSSHLYKTINGGVSWSDIGTGLPDVPTSAVVIDPQDPNIIYVGNDIGVYVSTDGGLTWQAFLQGLPSAVLVMDLSISPSNRKIRAVTHGNGVYERSLLPSTKIVEESASGVREFKLYQNYPNPFNPMTVIPFSLPQSSYVMVKIYNLLGQEVRTVIANGYPAGRHSVSWDGRDNFGKLAASGVYVAVMQTETVIQRIKMTLVR